MHAENVQDVWAEIPVLEVKLSISHRGKLDVGDYHIGSKVNAQNKRYWPCPYKKCDEYFFSSRKCGAHLNEHLRRVYVCEQCKYKTYNLDSYNHHCCFSGRKTQSGETKEGKKYQKQSSKSSGKQSEETGHETTTSEQPSTSISANAEVRIWGPAVKFLLRRRREREKRKRRKRGKQRKRGKKNTRKKRRKGKRRKGRKLR